MEKINPCICQPVKKTVRVVEKVLNIHLRVECFSCGKRTLDYDFRREGYDATKEKAIHEWNSISSTTIKDYYAFHSMTKMPTKKINNEKVDWE
jgi:hypothetical protein